MLESSHTVRFHATSNQRPVKLVMNAVPLTHSPCKDIFPLSSGWLMALSVVDCFVTADSTGDGQAKCALLVCSLHGQLPVSSQCFQCRQAFVVSFVCVPYERVASNMSACSYFSVVPELFVVIH